MGRVRLDLHVHSRYSPDSSLSLQAIAARVAALGLQGFALTDHNTVAGHAELVACRAQYPQLVLLPGIEVSTSDGHLLAYGISEVPPVGRPVDETIEWVRGHGGVAALSHPFRRSHGVGRALAEIARVHAIETVNGHNSPSANRKAAAVAVQRKLPTTGGGDVHELADLGVAYTEFGDDAANPEAVSRALTEGRMTAGGGSLPFPARARIEMRTMLLRVRRGLQPI